MYEFRSVDRQPVDGKVYYVFGGVRHAARVSDMASAGCRLSLGGVVPDTGDRLQLVLLEDLEVPAAVIWTDGDTIGVEFEEPVIDAVVRYFGMLGPAATPADVTKDSFGRALPPLGRGDMPR